MGMLENKKIVITGASQGIGFVVAKKCIAEGADVIIISRNEKELRQAADDLSLVSSRKQQYYQLDVGDLGKVQQFASWLREKKITFEGLVNCAGVYGSIGKTTEVDLAEFTKTIQINLLGTVYMCSCVGRLMQSEKRKKIVNYSGGGAATPFPHYSAYASSKAAVVRFTENLALELQNDGIDVNCIAPGFVVTRLHQQTLTAGMTTAGASFYEMTKKQIENGGIPPEKAADLNCFLLSELSDGITGKFISAPWDPWQTEEFQKQMRDDKDAATLRRIDQKTFFKKS